MNAARALFVEAETGSIEPGKSADIVVVDRDLLAVSPDEIGEARVLLTLFGAEEVFRDASREARVAVNDWRQLRHLAPGRFSADVRRCGVPASSGPTSDADKPPRRRGRRPRPRRLNGTETSDPAQAARSHSW